MFTGGMSNYYIRETYRRDVCIYTVYVKL